MGVVTGAVIQLRNVDSCGLSQLPNFAFNVGMRSAQNYGTDFILMSLPTSRTLHLLMQLTQCANVSRDFGVPLRLIYRSMRAATRHAYVAVTVMTVLASHRILLSVLLILLVSLPDSLPCILLLGPRWHLASHSMPSQVTPRLLSTCTRNDMIMFLRLTTVCQYQE